MRDSAACAIKERINEKAVLSSQFSVLSSQFSVLSSQFSGKSKTERLLTVKALLKESLGGIFIAEN
jgi:stress-induced morphogen